MRRRALAAISLVVVGACSTQSGAKIDTAEAYRRCQYYIEIKEPDEKPFEFASFENIKMGVTVNEGGIVRIVAPYAYTFTPVDVDTRTRPYRSTRGTPMKVESLFDCSVQFIDSENWNLKSLRFGSNAAA